MPKFQVLENPAYHERAAELYDIFLDHPMPPLDEGAFYVERQIRHGNRSLFFRRKGMDLDLLAFHCLDFLLPVVLFVYVMSK